MTIQGRDVNQSGGRDARPRRGGQQRVWTVKRTERLTPHLVRVHLGGEDFEPFIADADPERLAKTDKYVKMLFAKPELGLTPPYDLEELRQTLPLEDLPVRRTYTVRSIDHDARTVAIDFVVHGAEGVAGPWAATAKPGDRVSFSGPGGLFEPSQDASVPRLLLGDESSVPAISAALEAMPVGTTGLALIEVDAASDELDLARPEGVEVRWLHREGAVHGTVLVDAVRALPTPDPLPEVFAHGERGAVKQLRRILHNEWGIERGALSLSAYWALGRAEDGFQAEKREAVGKIFDE
ncbi:siderophore-interacting protein [Paramicrobacterium sp. CJ85]|uniref:siderophore-interacting protein n=1 Tax=Paramicrobacterium sp. CJ85 TaxID=3445355 RepID=UPI003F64912B